MAFTIDDVLEKRGPREGQNEMQSSFLNSSKRPTIIMGSSAIKKDDQKELGVIPRREPPRELIPFTINDIISGQSLPTPPPITSAPPSHPANGPSLGLEDSSIINSVSSDPDIHFSNQQPLHPTVLEEPIFTDLDLTHTISLLGTSGLVRRPVRRARYPSHWR